MRLTILATTLGLGLASVASAQTCIHYWNFSSTNDVVGSVPTVGVGSPDLSQHVTYGEAYAGSGASLNTILGGTNNGSGYLEAAILTGPMLEMDFGTDSFSLSYWAWDDFAADADGRGVRVFDNLAGTDVGIQLGSNGANHWNFRVDDDQGAFNTFNNAAPFVPPVDTWYHVTCAVDRVAGQVHCYIDGALQASTPLVDNPSGSVLVGNIFPTMDLRIGVINNGNDGTGAQTQGLDDLAFYEGVLSAADAMALATAAVIPSDFMGGINRYCTPAVANSTGASGVIDGFGSFVATDNNLTLQASSLPMNSFGFFLTSQTQGMIAQPGGSQGVLCLSGSIGRYVGAGQILNSGSAGSFSLLLDLTQTLTPTGLVTVMAGETWNFTSWHRDAVGGSATSNFTDAVSISFQ